MNILVAKRLLDLLKKNKANLDDKIVKFVPINTQLINETNCIDLMNKWRIENELYSPNKFNPTYERTKKWLLDTVINNEERIIFMLCDHDSNFFGHIGFTIIDNNVIRIESVMKGIKDYCPGIMEKVVNYLVSYLKREIGASIFDLLVLSENEKAIRLYKKCNFAVIEYLPLQKSIINHEEIWEINKNIANPEKLYIRMVREFK